MSTGTGKRGQVERPGKGLNFVTLQVQAGENDQANAANPTRGMGTVSPSSCSNPIIYHDLTKPTTELLLKLSLSPRFGSGTTVTITELAVMATTAMKLLQLYDVGAVSQLPFFSLQAL